VIAPGGVLVTHRQHRRRAAQRDPGRRSKPRPPSAGALLGLAFQTSNFAAVLEFLGTQGNYPGAVEPAHRDDEQPEGGAEGRHRRLLRHQHLTTTTPVGNTTSTTPSIGVTPFFSGISLDVTPSINDHGFITLHIHPAVSNVTERNKVLNLGTLGTYTLPLAPATSTRATPWCVPATATSSPSAA
jgi:MSHA biogenesis protein MshL